MKRILIFERESSTVNILKNLFDVLNIHSSVFLTWNDSINIPAKEIAAIFINIEMPGLDVAKVVNHYRMTDRTEIPIYLLISQKKLDLYEKVKHIQHNGKLIKPFKMEEVFYILERPLDLNSISLDQFDLFYQYSKFRDYLDEMEKWIDNLKVLINK